MNTALVDAIDRVRAAERGVRKANRHLDGVLEDLDSAQESLTAARDYHRKVLKDLIDTINSTDDND